MKVVLFCGGQGLRLREYSENVPKPMVPIGYRPIIWHLMRYYAHYGHREFILCLGYKADAIKEYFLNYNECVSNDFVLTNGGRDVRLLSRDADDWSITFVDTGFDSNIGERLMAVREHLQGEETFMANYADNLTDCPIDRLIEFHEGHGKVASFLSVKPSQSFHLVESAPEGKVERLVPATRSDMWINGGYFVFNRRLFDHMREGEELVLKPFERLIEADQLRTLRHDGFWACMDTFKEKQTLDDLHGRGRAPWEVWTKNGSRRARGAA
jgi:glucose-1-phosphate cytidylyltransferase